MRSGARSELRRATDVAETSAVEEAFVAFQNLTPDGFVMFRPVRSPDGKIVDLQWTFINAAAGGIIGRKPQDLLGKYLLVEMPGNREDGLFDAYVEVIETGRTWQSEFHYDHGGINAWFRTTAARAGDGLAISFADITAIRAGDERLRTTLDGVIGFVGVLSLDGTLLEANEPAILATGLDREDLIGKPFWELLWWNFDRPSQERLKEAIAEAATGRRVRYDAEIRIVGDRRMWIDFQIVPVLDSRGDVVELIPSGVDITERKSAEEHKELLIRELSHRVKNTLATIQSLAGQTIRHAASTEDFRTSFDARLRSIASSHDLLVASEHRQASLVGLIRGQVAPYAAEDTRLKIIGDDILLPGDVAHSLGLVLHELATNAAKHGALSTDAGRITVGWQVTDRPDGPVLSLSWVETGGPEVTPPTRRGFGTRLIERSLADDSDDAVFDFAPQGLRCNLTITLS